MYRHAERLDFVRYADRLEPLAREKEEEAHDTLPRRAPSASRG
jgi:hypothetical protein